MQISTLKMNETRCINDLLRVRLRHLTDTSGLNGLKALQVRVKPDGIIDDD